MPTNEFWHGDMRLLEVYQKAYMRNISYTAWANGNYIFEALHKYFNNSNAKNVSQLDWKWNDWKDPMERYEKPKVTQGNVEESFRNEHIAQNAWLHDILKK